MFDIIRAKFDWLFGELPDIRNPDQGPVASCIVLYVYFCSLSKGLKMKLSTIALAATISAAPFAANALSVADVNGNHLLGSCGDIEWTDIVEGNGSAGSYTTDFQSCTTPADGTAHVTIGTSVAGTFANLVASWENGDTVQVTDAGFQLLPGEVFDLFTVFTAATNPQALTFTWDASTKGAGFDYTVSSVPLPAGVLLLGTAIAGLGFARRKA